MAVSFNDTKEAQEFVLGLAPWLDFASVRWGAHGKDGMAVLSVGMMGYIRQADVTSASEADLERVGSDLAHAVLSDVNSARVLFGPTRDCTIKRVSQKSRKKKWKKAVSDMKKRKADLANTYGIEALN